MFVHHLSFSARDGPIIVMYEDRAASDKEESIRSRNVVQLGLPV